MCILTWWHHKYNKVSKILIGDILYLNIFSCKLVRTLIFLNKFNMILYLIHYRIVNSINSSLILKYFFMLIFPKLSVEIWLILKVGCGSLRSLVEILSPFECSSNLNRSRVCIGINGMAEISRKYSDRVTMEGDGEDL
jgi:hypothetical protein